MPKRRRADDDDGPAAPKSQRTIPPHNEVVGSSALSSNQSLSDSRPKKPVWPALTTREELLVRYYAQKQYLLDWEQTFESENERKPKYCDVDNAHRWEDFARIHKELFPKPGEPPITPMTLPTEIWEGAFAYLDDDDLIACQLVSRDWANMSWRLISENYFYLWRDRADLEKLEHIGRDDRLRSTIKAVKFCIGGATDIPKSILRDDLTDPRQRYFPYKTSLEVQLWEIGRIMEEYDQWRRQKESAAQDYTNAARLSDIFGNFGSMKKVEISTEVHPWKNEILRSFWTPGVDVMNSTGPTQTIEEIKTILHATRQFELRELCFRDIPVEFFVGVSIWLRNEALHYKYLELLHLLVNSGIPDTVDRFMEVASLTTWFHGIRKLLETCPNLKRLHFRLTDSPSEEPVWWSRIHANGPLPCFAFRTLIKPDTWSHLRELVLGGLVVGVKDLLNFLSFHSLSIRKLELYDMKCQGSIECLLRGIRNIMTKLSIFHLHGIWTSSVMADGMAHVFVFERIHPLYDDDEPFDWVLRSEEDQGGWSGEIQKYVLRQIPTLEPKIFGEGNASNFKEEYDVIEELSGTDEGMQVDESDDEDQPVTEDHVEDADAESEDADAESEDAESEDAESEDVDAESEDAESEDAESDDAEEELADPPPKVPPMLWEMDL